MTANVNYIKYILKNKNGGFTFVTKEQFLAWKHDPSKACANDKSLLESLHRQTLNRGFNYKDFTPIVEILP